MLAGSPNRGGFRLPRIGVGLFLSRKTVWEERQMATEINEKIYCSSEYDALKRVVVCKPSYMSINKIINETQKHYAEDNIDVELALRQHEQFVRAMKRNGIEVIELPAFENLPEQVFTRDIGFTIGSEIFVGEMSCGVRQGEEKVLKQWLINNKVTYKDLTRAEIEGGDILIDNKTIYVGISERTSLESVMQLRELVDPSFEILPIPFNSKYLHLDCVFNILSGNEALVYPDAFMKNELELLASRYELIEVSGEEQFTMGTNVLNLGNRHILSLPMNKNVNEQLRNRGYTVTEIDLSEIIKSGGSFRCCSLPLVRVCK